MTRMLKRRLEALERRAGTRRGEPIENWEQYGTALREGWLHEAELSLTMRRKLEQLVVQKLAELVKSRGHDAARDLVRRARHTVRNVRDARDTRTAK